MASLDAVLDVVAVYDNKMFLTKDVRSALGGIKSGDKVVCVAVENGVLLYKSRNDFRS